MEMKAETTTSFIASVSRKYGQRDNLEEKIKDDKETSSTFTYFM